MHKPSLFEEIDCPTVTINEAATRIGVSTATIRNWIKAKYLSQAGKDTIHLKSLEKFEDEISGKEKLIHRANKSTKDDHDHEKLTSEIITHIANVATSSNNVGLQYEERLSDSYRNKEGIYYTPQDVVSDLFQQSLECSDDLTFCDPCCGSGNFIIQAIKNGFKPENIFGYDIDPIAVEITKARIYETTGYKSENIKVGDFLDIAVKKSARKYDYIFTNPPWGKKLAKEIRLSVGASLGAGSSIDTCSLFFFACIATLKREGKLGLLLPEAFFNIAVYEDARMKATNLHIERLIDYGKTFKGLVTKAQAIVIKNIEIDITTEISCRVNGFEFSRLSTSFLSNPKSILNLYCNAEDARTLEHLLSIPYITLKGRANWGLGIVTGNNSKYVVDSAGEGLIPFYKGSDITNKGLKDVSGYIPSDLSIYQQTAPRHIYEAEEKLVYKFISSKLCFFYDDKQRFFLNSANMMIPYTAFPVSTRFLADYLSSDIMNWIFKNLFNTHKVLRGDIELIPIYSQFLNDLETFDEKLLLNKLNIRKKPDGTYGIKE